MAKGRYGRRGERTEEVSDDIEGIDEPEINDDAEVVEDRPARRRRDPGRTAFVAGLVAVGFVFLLSPFGLLIPGLVIAIAAVVLSVRAKRKADRGEEVNRRQANWGLITGIAALVLGGLSLGTSVRYYYFTDEGKELRRCYDQAGDDEDARDRCQEAADS